MYIIKTECLCLLKAQEKEWTEPPVFHSSWNDLAYWGHHKEISLRHLKMCFIFLPHISQSLYQCNKNKLYWIVKKYLNNVSCDPKQDQNTPSKILGNLPATHCGLIFSPFTLQFLLLIVSFLNLALVVTVGRGSDRNIVYLSIAPGKPVDTLENY